MVDLQRIKKSDLWYVVGYIATDGSLSIDGRHINITSKDRQHLYLIRSALFLTNKIGRKTRAGDTEKTYSQIQIGDVVFYRYLLSLGLTPNKSLTLGTLKIDRVYINDFLRGVIDGDGSISTWVHRTNGHVQWSLRIVSASNKFINWLKDITKETYGIDGRVYTNIQQNRKNPMYLLKFGKRSATKVLPFVYYSGCLGLERKLKQVGLCLQ